MIPGKPQGCGVCLLDSSEGGIKVAQKLCFPKGFLWGTATASFQIEGGYEERGESIWDEFCRWPGKVSDGDTGLVADDHYHRYQEDVALMKSLGVGAYRFSISWPRVLPNGVGRVNAKGLDFYDRLVDELLRAGIQPFATLYHWDLPSALQREGGWVARDTAYRFADYVAIVAQRLGDRVQRWITHNEPWVAAFIGHLGGRHAPGWNDWGAALQVGHHLLLSHGLAVPVLREKNASAQVGITLNLQPTYPASEAEADVLAARRADGYQNRWFLGPVFRGVYPQDMWQLFDYQVPRVAQGDMEIIRAPIDFLGVNFYSRGVYQDAPNAPGPLKIQAVHPAGEYTAMNWEVYPQGLTDLLLRLTKDYSPQQLFITENGCSYEDVLTADGRVHDAKRVDYLRQHFIAAQRAIAQGAPLKGYLVWSLMDNFEWSFGYSRRFGIVYVDYATQRRIPKDSAHFLRSVATQNAVEA
jgi:beta-glucosidase